MFIWRKNWGRFFIWPKNSTPIFKPYEQFNPISPHIKTSTWVIHGWISPEKIISITLDFNFTRIQTPIFTPKSPKFLKIIPESKSVIVSFAGMSKLSLGKVNLPQSWGRFLSSGCSQYGSSVTVTFEWVGFVITSTKLFSSVFDGFQINYFYDFEGESRMSL